jgi:hypothetical protein
MSILRILCYNGSLVTSTVVSLTSVKFKPLIFFWTFFPIVLLTRSRHGPRRKQLPTVALMLRADSLPWEPVRFGVANGSTLYNTISPSPKAKNFGIFLPATWHMFPEDITPHCHRNKNLKCHFCAHVFLWKNVLLNTVWNLNRQQLKSQPLPSHCNTSQLMIISHVLRCDFSHLFELQLRV